MDKLKHNMEKCADLGEKLFKAVEEECAKGDSGCIEKAEKMVDMIKDISDTEKNIAEACYYKCLAQAMHDAEEEEKMMGKMGYNPNRYASGRYAPAGHGNYTSAGFHPSGHEYGMDRYPMYMMEEERERMGYPTGGSSSSSNSGSSSSGSDGRGGSSSNSGGRSGFHASPEQMIEQIIAEYKNGKSPEEKRHIKEKMQHAMSNMS